VHRLWCLRRVSTPTAFGLAVGLGDWDLLTGASIGAYLRSLPPSPPQDSPAPRAQSPRPATPSLYPEPADTPAARSRLEVRTTDAGRMDGPCGFRQFGMAPEDDRSRRARASASAAPSRPRRSPRTLQGYVRTRSDWPKLRCSTWSSYSKLLGSMPGRPSMARRRLGPPISGSPDSRGQSSRLSQPRLLGSIFLTRKHTATPGGQRNEGTA
jgi:hypothetical protein